MNDIITRKLNEIKKQKERAIANLNALTGAEQVLEQLIAEINRNEVTEDAESND